MKFFLFLFAPLLVIENAWARTMLGQGMNSKHCFSPTIENGWVEAENNVQGNSFVGRFRCSSGFLLTGEQTIKCRDGVWTIKPRDFPYCAAIGSCDVTQLPQIKNGNLKADKRYMASVYKYKCNKGYQMIGPSKVYCTRQGWSVKEAPSCAKSGCDSDELLGEGLKHGRVRQMFGGKVFRFRCDEGSVMSGSPQVFCDGRSWNESMPNCFVPPRSPLLAIFVDGKTSGRRLAAAVGQKVTISCQNTGGHPSPTLSLRIGDQKLEQASHTFTMEEEHSNIHLSCAAENILSTSPVSSQYQVLRLKYAPKESYLKGDEEVKTAETAEYFCSSDESDPAPDVSVVARDQNGEKLAIIRGETQPNMKTRNGFAASLWFKVMVETGVTQVEVECRAANEVGEAFSLMTTTVKYAPETVTISGPEMVKLDEDSLFTCISSASNPEPIIEWKILASGQEDNDVVVEKETDGETEKLEDGGFRRISTLVLPASREQSVQVNCVVTVPELDFMKVSEMLEVTRMFPPKRIFIEGPDTVKREEVSQFSCTVEGGFPQPQISMTVFKDDDLISSNDQDKITVDLTNTSDITSITVKCEAGNQAGALQNSQTVPIHWAPAHVFVTGPESIKEGDDADYECESAPSNPPANIIWRITDEDEKPVLFSEETNTNSSSIKISGVERTQRSFTVLCMGINSVGSVEDSFTSMISGPTQLLITGPDMLDSVLDSSEDVHYYCSADESLADILIWTLNGKIMIHQADTKETSPEEGNVQTHSVFSIPPALLLPGTSFTVGCHYNKLTTVKSVQIKELVPTTNQAESEQETNGFVKLEPAQYEEDFTPEGDEWIPYASSPSDNQQDFIFSKSTEEEIIGHRTRESKDNTEPIFSRAESEESDIVLKSSDTRGVSAELSSKNFHHSFSDSANTAPYKLLTIVFVTVLVKIL